MLKIITILFISTNFIFAQYTGNPPSEIERNSFLNNTIIKNNETRISNSIPTETDIRVAINPKDSNNIILTSIQHRLNNEEDSFIMPIYYTLDNGRKWQRSQYRLLPNEDYRTILEANSPAIGFTRDGKAVLSWAVTYITQRFPGVDSIHHQVLVAYSNDKGSTWEADRGNPIFSRQNIRDRGDANFGRINQYESIQVLNDSFRNKDYLFVLDRRIDSISKTKFYLFSINDDLILEYENDTFIENFGLFSKFDCEIDSDGNLNMAFLSVDQKVQISYSKLDFENDELLDLKNISEVSYTGGFYFPGSFLNNEIALSGSYFAPTPKMLLINNEKHFFWNASGLENQDFDHNIYYSKIDANDLIFPPRIVNKEKQGFQFNPNAIKINDHILLSYFDRNYEQDSSTTDMVFAYSNDFANTFKGYFKLNYQSSDHSLIDERNFNYGVGINQGLVANSSHFFQFWPDARTGDGNLEIYGLQLPVLENIEEFIEEETKIQIFGPEIYNMIYSFVIDTKYQQNCEVFITDITGKRLLVSETNVLLPGKNRFRFDMSNFANGSYFFVAEIGNKLYSQTFLYY